MIVLIIINLVVIPLLIGMLYTKFISQKQNSLFFNFLAGYIIMWAIFEIITLPMTYLGASLTRLQQVYIVVLLLLVLLSLVLNFKRIGKIGAETFLYLRKMSVSMCGAVVLTGFQIFMYVRYMHIDDDDAFYVGTAVTAVHTDTIFQINPYTGIAYNSFPARYVLSPFPIFNAVMSKTIHVEPTIFMHSILPVFMIILTFAVFKLLGEILFKEDKVKVGYFLIFLNVIHMFTGFSSYTLGMMMNLRIWQGKAILAAILLPMIFALVMKIYLVEKKKVDWILMFCLMGACCMVSSMGVMLGAILVGILGLYFSISQKSIRPVLILIGCCLINIICAVAYIVIR